MGAGILAITLVEMANTHAFYFKLQYQIVTFIFICRMYIYVRIFRPDYVWIIAWLYKYTHG